MASQSSICAVHGSAIGVQREDVSHGAVHRRLHADLRAEFDDTAREPAQLERLSGIQIVMHRCRHLGWPAVKEWDALLGVVGRKADAMGSADRDDFAR